MEIKEISYKDERLEFFVDQQRVVQRRYDKLEKQIRPDEPYLSERRQLLSDCGRELSFYNDVIEMLENDVVPKSEVANEIIDCIAELTEITDYLKRFDQYYQIGYCQAMNVILSGLGELKKKYATK